MGLFDYTPDANFNGIDGFTVLASDGNGGTDTTTVNITVNPVNDAPAGSPAAGLPGGTENVAYIVAEADLLAGFTDADDTALSIANLTASDGAVAGNGNGNGIYTITLTTGFTGTVTLTYDVTDGHGGVLHHQDAKLYDQRGPGRHADRGLGRWYRGRGLHGCRGGPPRRVHRSGRQPAQRRRPQRLERNGTPTTAMALTPSPRRRTSTAP